MTFILRETFDWNAMVKTAGRKLAADPMQAPAAPAPDPAAPPLDEGMPTAPGRKPMPDEEPGVQKEPMEYLQKEHKEIENAKAIVMQMWGLLTGEAGEGGYDEVKYLLDAIKSMEEFITVEETGVKPGKGKKAASFLRYAGKLKEMALPIYDELSTQKALVLGRELTEEEEINLWQEASKILGKMLKDKTPEPPEESAPTVLDLDETPAEEVAGESANADLPEMPPRGRF